MLSAFEINTISGSR